MRSLTVKLTLAFLVVGLTGALLVAIITRQRTQSAFNQFIQERERQTLVASLESYYQVIGSWDGVAESLNSGLAVDANAALTSDPRASDGDSSHPVGIHRDYRRLWSHFTLVGLDKTIVYNNSPALIGQPYNGRDLSSAIQLSADNAPIGWLILDPNPDFLLQNTPEGAFLERVQGATVVSALVAGTLALLLGGLLAFTMTRSLRELREATEEIARGNLGRQVKIRSQDELGALAASFNKMSADLGRAIQARRQMTADIAHDLRTPLSVIAGYSEALSEGKLAGNPEVYGILYQETRYLNRLVEDLRTLSLADAGELPLTLQPTQVELLISQAASRHAVAAQQRQVTLQVEPGDQWNVPGKEAPPSLQADPERLSQVLDNLISNALRHTPPGGTIRLASRRLGDFLELEVRDNGSGISPEDLPHIFDRSYRGDKSRQQTGESGLGLSIARSIVEAHHGTIAVESREGQGTAFVIRLPVK